MSKKLNVPSGTAVCNYGYGYAVSQNMPDRLTGMLLGVLEALGLPEKQENATKDLIRQKVWQAFEDAVYITDKRHTEIREAYYQQKREASAKEMPTSAV